MVLQSLRYCAVFASSLCLLAFSGTWCKTAFAVQTTHFLSSADTRALYGDHIQASVYNNGSYHTVTFDYLGDHPTNSTGLRQLIEQPENGHATEFNNWPCVEYYCSDVGSITADNSAVTVYLNPEYSIFGTTNFSTLIGITSNQSVPDSVYDPSYWEFRSPSLGTLEFSGVKYQGDYRFSGATNEYYSGDNNVLWIPVDIIDNPTTFEISSIEVRFRGCSPFYHGVGNEMYLYIGCPRVDDVSEVSSGIITTTEESSSGSGSGGGGSGADLTETNGLIGGVISAIRNIGEYIWSGITAVFVPSDDDIQEFKDSVEETLSDTFAPLFVAAELTDDAMNIFQNVTADGRIPIPGITVPSLLQGQSEILGSGAVIMLPQTAEILPDKLKFATLYDTFKWVIDVLATIAVINMLRNKFDAIILGEVVVSHVD